MVDISQKNSSERYAKAQAIVRVSKSETIDAVNNKTVPKGDVLEFAKVAGLFGVKKTAELIPDCHPIPIEFTKISYEISALEIKIIVEVKTVYKTGVEVEAMHGASLVALTLYDMLKPIDKGIEILNIKLLDKTGGKSDHKKSDDVFSAKLIVFSNSVASGKKQDKVSVPIKEMLAAEGITLRDVLVVEENIALVENLLTGSPLDIHLLIIAGGTGITPKDLLPNMLKNHFEVSADSLMEASRQYGFERDYKAMLSGGVAGLVGKSLIINIPGSSNGAIATMKPIARGIRHILENMLKLD